MGFVKREIIGLLYAVLILIFWIFLKIEIFLIFIFNHI